MWKNKVAIITGAGKGIGKAIALGMAKLNYQTILIGRNQENLENVSNTILNLGALKPILCQLDITDRSATQKAIKTIASELGHVEVLVNNAGIYYDGSVNISEEDFEKQLATNLTAQYSILKEVVPIMKAQRSGYIFNVASRAGKIGFAGSGAYSASKFGLVGLSESLYRELNPLGIRVTALCPGWVDTRMAYQAGTPLDGEQMIQPEDLMRTIEWLLSLSAGACVKEVVLETPYNIS